MKLGLGLPHLGVEATPQKIVEFAQRAEALGFDSLWVLERGSQRLGSTQVGHQHSGKGSRLPEGATAKERPSPNPCGGVANSRPARQGETRASIRRSNSQSVSTNQSKE
jgi:hypothetical protein